MGTMVNKSRTGGQTPNTVVTIKSIKDGKQVGNTIVQLTKGGGGRGGGSSGGSSGGTQAQLEAKLKEEQEKQSKLDEEKAKAGQLIQITAQQKFNQSTGKIGGLSITEYNKQIPKNTLTGNQYYKLAQQEYEQRKGNEAVYFTGSEFRTASGRTPTASQLDKNKQTYYGLVAEQERQKQLQAQQQENAMLSRLTPEQQFYENLKQQDIKTQTQILASIREAKKQGKTIIFPNSNDMANNQGKYSNLFSQNANNDNVLILTDNKIPIINGQKGYNELGLPQSSTKTKGRQPNILGEPKQHTDISDDAFNKQFSNAYKNIPSIINTTAGEIGNKSRDFLSSNFGIKFEKDKAPVIEPDKGFWNKGVTKTKTKTFLGKQITYIDYETKGKKKQDAFYAEPSGGREDKVKAFFESPFKKTLAQGYDVATDAVGSIIGTITRPINFSESMTKKYYLSKNGKIINPKESALFDIKTDKEKLTNERLSDFYTGKQIAETAGFLAGGEIGVLSTIGASARAKNTEELILPVAFGVGGRVVAKPIGSLLSKTTGGVNKLIGGAEKIITSKKPVIKDVISPNALPRLTDSATAKIVLLGGGLVEVAGVSITPLEEKKEYIRQIGLFNAVTPMAYRATDTGIMLGKYASVNTIDLGFKVAEKAGIKNVRGFDVYDYSEFAQKDAMKTPTFIGTEKEMLLSSRDTKRAGAGAIYKKYPALLKEKNVIGLRSVPSKLTDTVEPFVGGYEGSKVSFFSSEINPIGIRNSGSGLRNRLFGKAPTLYDQYSLQVGEPAIEATLFTEGKAINLKKGKAFTDKAYKEFQDIYGLAGREKTFSTDVSLGGIKVPKGKTFGQAEYEKIIGGKATYGADKGSKLSRPLKNRETISITSQEAFEKNFINMDKSLVGKERGIFSTEARSLGATSESEFATASIRKRVAPDTRAKKFFRKLGFADAYVNFDFEAIPINYEKTLPTNALVTTNIGKQNKLLTEKKQNLLTGKSANIVPRERSLAVRDNFPIKVAKREGDYSKYLKKAFGRKFVGEQLSRFVPVKKTNGVSLLSNKKVSLSGKYTTDYVTPYSPKYTPAYKPKYVPPYVPKYTPPYTPSYTPTYTPKYKPVYAPTYTPKYTPPYTPPYKPKYTPPYTPPYRPKYTPPYTPPYKPKYYGLKQGTNKSSDKTPTYDVYVRGSVKGTKSISPQQVAKDLPINKAINAGTRVASEYTQRTVQLRRSGFTSARDEQLNTRTFNQYRGLTPTSKIKRATLNYVEKSRYAIDSRNEKLGISFKGQQARKRKATERRLRLI